MENNILIINGIEYVRKDFFFKIIDETANEKENNSELEEEEFFLSKTITNSNGTLMLSRDYDEDGSPYSNNIGINLIINYPEYGYHSEWDSEEYIKNIKSNNYVSVFEDEIKSGKLSPDEAKIIYKDIVNIVNHDLTVVNWIF